MGKKSRKLRSPKYAKKAATLREKVEALRTKASNITKTLERVERIVESLEAEVVLPPTPTPLPAPTEIEQSEAATPVTKKETKEAVKSPSKRRTPSRKAATAKPKTTRKRSTRKPTANK